MSQVREDPTGLGTAGTIFMVTVFCLLVAASALAAVWGDPDLPAEGEYP